jgi:hypothetical protein
VACGGGGGNDTPDARPGIDAAVTASATAHFAPPATPGSGADWGAVPYPSDIYLDSDGALALGSLPTGPGEQEAFVTALLEGLATMDGAGLWSSAVFPIDGELDADTVAGNVKLVELPSLTEIETDVLWRSDLGAIVAVPKLGTLLKEKTTYAAYVTTAVEASDGTPLARSAAFDEALASGTPSTDGIGAARTVLQPLLDQLDSATRDSLAVATVFTTESVTDMMVAMHEVITASPPANPAVTRTFTGTTELDGLFGVQSGDALPGFKHPTDGSPNQYRNQPHDHVAAVVHGTIDLKRFLNADPHIDGFTEVDGSGTPTVKGTETVPFTLVLPDTGSWADLPVVVYVPGINRTRLDALTQADTAADNGWAVITIDMPYHGSRAKSPVDDNNEVTGASTPDGIGDDLGQTPATQIFHLSNSGGIAPFHPRAMRENLRQASLDICSLVEYVANGDVGPITTAIEAADSALPGETLSFRDNVALLTESFGGMVSTPCIAVEPRIGAAVLSSPAAGFPFPSMIHSPNFSGLFFSAVTNPYGIADRVTLGDPVKGARFEPIFMLYNSVLERGEGSGFAAQMMSGALRGGTGPHLAVMMAWSDEWVSNDTTEHFAGVMGLPRLVTTAPMSPPGDYTRYVALPTETAPLSGNLGGGNQTAAVTVYYPSAHASIRKVTDLWRFEPGFPPFVELDPEQPLAATPVGEMHAQYSAFLTDYFAGSTPAIIDPYN